jgi:hypothetical protein
MALCGAKSACEGLMGNTRSSSDGSIWKTPLTLVADSFPSLIALEIVGLDLPTCFAAVPSVNMSVILGVRGRKVGCEITV